VQKEEEYGGLNVKQRDLVGCSSPHQQVGVQNDEKRNSRENERVEKMRSEKRKGGKKTQLVGKSEPVP